MKPLKNMPKEKRKGSKNKMPRGQSTEVDAYIFIKENLRNLGWNTRNPFRHAHGQVYTQNECHSNTEIHRQLGQETPENIVKIKESIFWVIEAKKEHQQLQQALNEAEEYAKKINRSRNIKAKFVTGVAGNDADSYVIKSEFFDGKKFRSITINEREVSGLLSQEIVETILETDNPSIKDVPIDENLFLQKAEKINEILHAGAIHKDYRARVMSALLLSLVDETQPNIDARPSVLIGDINSRAKAVLEREGKPEFYEYIKLSLPATPDNHMKFKNALVRTIQELNNLNIRSAMNSGTDVLGKFYEVFLKYGNGAKEIGIVLTPRHITQFAVEVMGIKPNDLVYDPCCGTGGFLVSAFDYIRRNYERQLDRFKKSNLFGVDEQSSVVSLAIVNMIFRGDGKNNIIEGNCFQRNLVPITIEGIATAKYNPTPSEEGSEPITKVLMNPPFPTEKSDEKEYAFVDCGLGQMQDGGTLFSVLPYSCMVKSGSHLRWRKRLLENNTLLAVMTFPEDLFYPIGVHTIGVFIKKGVPHPREQKVFWIRALNDGLLKKKGKRLPNPRAKNDFPKIKEILKAFLTNQNIQILNIKQFQKVRKIDFSDENFELIPEAYLDEKEIKAEELEKEIEGLIRENIAFNIKFEERLSKIKNANSK